MKLDEIRELSISELEEKVVELKKKLFTLRMDKAVQKEIEPSEFGKTRKTIAQMKTVIREKLAKKEVQDA